MLRIYMDAWVLVVFWLSGIVVGFMVAKIRRR